MPNYLDLYDYRCRMSELYRERTRTFLAEGDAARTLQQFRQGKDTLFQHHPQSALDATQQASFQGLRYFPYNPAMHLPATIELLEDPISKEVTMSDQETLTLLTIGQIHFQVANQQVTLSLYWLSLYGGGLFLPFHDTTCPQESYGGGRYLFDTIKGSEPFPDPHNRSQQHLILDFNYAYNPSCAYNSRWACPLAPRENHLPVAIRAGEKKYSVEDIL